MVGCAKITGKSWKISGGPTKMIATIIDSPDRRIADAAASAMVMWSLMKLRKLTATPKSSLAAGRYNSLRRCDKSEKFGASHARKASNGATCAYAVDEPKPVEGMQPPLSQGPSRHQARSGRSANGVRVVRG